MFAHWGSGFEVALVFQRSTAPAPWDGGVTQVEMCFKVSVSKEIFGILGNDKHGKASL